MKTSEYTQQRIEILDKLDELKGNHCDSCELMEKYSHKNQTTARTNACKSCPISHEMQCLGEQLLSTTKNNRKISK